MILVTDGAGFGSGITRFAREPALIPATILT